jgi:SagB-type dehydrogenase family enzyme
MNKGLSGFLSQLDGTRSPEAAAEEYLALCAQAESDRRARFSRFGVPLTARCPASRLYHRHSTLSPEWESPLSAEEVCRLTFDCIDVRYPDAPHIPLPAGDRLNITVQAAIRQRRTATGFANAPLTLDEVATLLRVAAGITQDGRLPLRAAPSAGGLQSVDTYALALNVSRLGSGVYHYVPTRHQVGFIRALRGVEDIWPGLPPGWHGETPALAIVLVARVGRVQAKYGERGYRFALLESGHIAQNVLLGAVGLRLAATAVGGFFDDAMNSLIGVNGTDETVLYAILLGRLASSQPVNA